MAHPDGSSEMRSFVIEELDPETMCILNVVEFQVEDLKALESELGIQIDQNLDRGVPTYEIDMAGVASLKRKFSLEGISGLRSGVLRLKTRADELGLSFPMHTNRELLLMLQNRKPMAFFSCYETESFTDICAQPFDKYVANGRLYRREFTCDSPRLRAKGFVGLRYHIFTLPEEVWRADAFMLLQNVSRQSGWGEGFERMECALLGYSDAEIEEYIVRVFRNTTLNSG